MSKTSNITIGLPVDVFVEYTLDDIKKKLISGLNSYSHDKGLNKKQDKIVTMTVRIDKEQANKIRAISDFLDMTIVDFTSRLF